jgi:predicted nucleic acid-binding protein
VLSYPVLLDSCVLFGSRLTDVLLYAANNRLFEPLWSDRILAAVVREVPKSRRNVTPEQIRRRVARMRAVFPDALVTGHEHLEPDMRNHPGDRHVLAAAVHGGADVVVTNNLIHFPLEEMDRHGIGRMTADEFLLDLLEQNPRVMLESVVEAIVNRRRPPESAGDFLDGLVKSDVETFAETVRGMLVQQKLLPTPPVEGWVSELRGTGFGVYPHEEQPND